MVGRSIIVVPPPEMNALQQRTRAVQLEGRRVAWGVQKPYQKCVEKLQAIVMVFKVDGTSLLLYTSTETLFSYAILVTKQ